MLFVTGEPNLVGRTRYYAGNPETEPSKLYGDQDVKNAINIAYDELWGRARSLGVDWSIESALISSVADQILYTLPADFDGKILSVELQEDGLAIADGVDTVFLRPKSATTSLEGWREGDFTKSLYYFLHEDSFGIVSPPSSSGANSIRITFEGEINYLAADGDEPKIPRSHRDLICLLAAISLREGKDLDSAGLRAEAARKYPIFIESMQEPVLDLEDQMTAVGRTPLNYSTRTGFVNRV